MKGGPRASRARLAATALRLTALLAIAVGSLVTLGAGLNGAAAADPPSAVGARAQTASALPPELHAAEVRSNRGMVASGIPEASRAGAQILEQGGNAVDAAVAAAFALTVVDPFNAGLGGQCYVLIHTRDGVDVGVDGSAPVPLRVVPEEIQPLKESGFLYGYKLAATPATPAALAYALRRYGTMTLAQVLAPAIELADYGHPLMPTVMAVVDHYAPRIRENGFLARTFLRDESDLWPAGHIYCQPVLAETMRRMAAVGVEDFYYGRIADAITDDMAVNGGYVSKSDLARVRVVERTPVRGTYRGVDVVSFPYPGGGEIVLEALQILSSFPPEVLRDDSPDRLQLLLEAVAIAFRDAITSAEPAFRDRASLDPTRAARRAALIRFDRALSDDELPVARGQWFQERETTHVSVVDSLGNAVALTQSLGYGSFVASPALGFQYNSLLETLDFCDRESPNSPAPFRTLSSAMTPTILLCNGGPFLVLGGPGSTRIPSTIVAVITNIVDRAMPLQEAVVAPRVLSNRPNPMVDRVGCRSAPRDKLYDEKVYLEIAGPITSEQADVLLARGFSEQYRLVFPPPDLLALRAFGGINAVMQDAATGMLVGVGDPRRHGAAAAPGLP